MRKFVFACTLLALLFFVNSCGMIHENFGRKDTTTLNIVVNQPAEFSALTWPTIYQAMVYIVGAQGTLFKAGIPITIPSGASSASAQISVPNGTYRSFALAWDGASANLSGKVGCFQDNGNGQTLTGSAQTANLTLKAAISEPQCNGYSGYGPFSDSGYGSTTNFNTLASIKLCLNSTGLTAGGCSTASATYVATASVQIVLDGYMAGGNQIITDPSKKLIGACSGAPTSALFSSLTNTVPVGSSTQDKFIATSILVFGNTTCSGNPAKIIHFPDGLINGSSDAPTSLSTSGTALAINVGT